MHAPDWPDTTTQHMVPVLHLSSAGRPTRAGGDQLMLMLQSVTLEIIRSCGAPGTASSKLMENFPLAPVS